ncbi:uncharacterized protein LOC27206933 [Drosophila simulans]|uniref:uncharacterized protein LOC27206933 n=1 Tax=Drosophila simulans TaxID=7240 RepID=UPI00078AF0F5|nr:uncharacterized protein LOC27206933 [Drosophila simulans]XP_044779378.1 uncharacterized protein LOC27206933 [Drosophila simulans]KMZ04260.1 uncharacterized protein Dsimw501_GD27083 [Drosophila simulans]
MRPPEVYHVYSHSQNHLAERQEIGRGVRSGIKCMITGKSVGAIVAALQKTRTSKKVFQNYIGNFNKFLNKNEEAVKQQDIYNINI